MSFELILAAFGGGVLGAVLGALPMFIMTGFLGLIGIAIVLSGGSPDFISQVVFGPLTGPHIAFAGGTAAAAFAAHRKNLLAVGSDILTSLYKTRSLSVILIGGIFGVFGYVVNYLLTLALGGIAINTIALTVVISGILARLFFGTAGFFSLKKGNKAQDEIAASEAVKKPFLLDSKLFWFNLIIALGFGCLFSYLGQITQINIIGFCFSAASLILIQVGYDVPLTHHVTLTAVNAALLTGNIYIGILFAVIAWIVGEIWENAVNAKDDTWLDPPSAALFICSAILLLIK